jgi:hypothetical protein
MPSILDIRRTRRYRASIWGLRLFGVAMVLLLGGIALHALLYAGIAAIGLVVVLIFPMHLAALSDPGPPYMKIVEWQLADAGNLRFW